jgi:hypothetical protein
LGFAAANPCEAGKGICFRSNETYLGIPVN